MFHAMVRFTLILLLYLRMLAIEVNHKWDDCQSKSALHHIRVCQGLFFATKRIGPRCCTLVTLVTCCLLPIILSQNYLLPLISVLAQNTLLKIAYHFLLLLVGFDTLTYLKDCDRSPILVGHQGSFLAPLPGSEAPLVGGIW